MHTPAVPAGQRIYAVGDIHGRLDLLDQILGLIRADAKGADVSDIVVLLLGDLIDRGPDSAGVVARAMEPLDFGRIIALTGNHEAAMLDALDGDRDMLRLWLRNGGDIALASWGVTADMVKTLSSVDLLEAIRIAIPHEQFAWLSRCPLSFASGDYYFVHAGIRPGIKFDRQSRDDMLWIREEFLESSRMHGAMIVHGHSVSATVEELPNRIGLDTGAYATGTLTAMGLEGTHRWLLQT